jgi:hypothetical protein
MRSETELPYLTGQVRERTVKIKSMLEKAVEGLNARIAERNEGFMIDK